VCSSKATERREWGLHAGFACHVGAVNAAVIRPIDVAVANVTHNGRGRYLGSGGSGESLFGIPSVGRYVTCLKVVEDADPPLQVAVRIRLGRGTN